MEKLQVCKGVGLATNSLSPFFGMLVGRGDVGQRIDEH